MPCEEQLALTLKEYGHRPTPQRLMILSAVRHSEDHVTAADVLEQVKESYSFIDLSTVYRTLDMLKQMRLVSETDMGSGTYAYEWLEQDRHHHLICSGCDRIEVLDNEFLRALDANILESYGFEADMDHIVLFGRCRECTAGSEEAP
jgi:Fur family ferric uptake transcriptional regulator